MIENSTSRRTIARLRALLAALAVVPAVAMTAPGEILFSDDFTDGLSLWTVSTPPLGTGAAGTNQVSGAAAPGAFTRSGTVTVTSLDTINAAVPAAELEIWVRRGGALLLGTDFPEAGKDFIIEYRRADSSWGVLATYLGGGTPGEIFQDSYVLPSDALHDSLAIRVRQTAGLVLFDYWHFDDIVVTELPVPDLSVTKLVLTLNDPVNGSSNPKAIPGATVRYTVGVTNQGPGAADAGSLVIADPVPAGTALYVDTSGGDPITFVDGPTASGLTYDYATDVTFSNQVGGGPPYNYTPVPDAQGFDVAVTGYLINPAGAMNGASGGNNPGFNLQLRARIE